MNLNINQYSMNVNEYSDICCLAVLNISSHAMLTFPYFYNNKSHQEAIKLFKALMSNCKALKCQPVK